MIDWLVGGGELIVCLLRIYCTELNRFVAVCQMSVEKANKMVKEADELAAKTFPPWGGKERKEDAIEGWKKAAGTCAVYQSALTDPMRFGAHIFVSYHVVQRSIKLVKSGKRQRNAIRNQPKQQTLSNRKTTRMYKRSLTALTRPDGTDCV